ncbi:hypothetical protein OAS39_05850 [Pirellulales bacterium]|nr:hypothetical protein [Pirellulales bacterium]
MNSQLPIVTIGILEQCPHQGCNHACCEFANGNFIALYPGELEKAKRAGLSVEHLHAIPDDAGGHRAICHANNKPLCDNGFKPLDCASYPLFPVVAPDGSIEASLKGSKCPLRVEDLTEHRKIVLSSWTRLETYVENLEQWLLSVRLVEYEEISELVKYQ